MLALKIAAVLVLLAAAVCSASSDDAYNTVMDVEDSVDEQADSMDLLSLIEDRVSRMSDDEKSYLRSELDNEDDEDEDDDLEEDDEDGGNGPSASQLLPGQVGGSPYKITSYGPTLQANKASLQKAFKQCSVTGAYQVLITAMAMLETNHMSLSERDTSKDKATDGSANVSIFNLSVDMVSRLGFSNPKLLNQPGQQYLSDAVCVLMKGFKSWGVASTLNYVRGGYTAWMDGKSYGAPAYRQTIVSIMNVIDSDKKLLTDSRRVEVFLGHV